MIYYKPFLNSNYPEQVQSVSGEGFIEISEGDYAILIANNNPPEVSKIVPSEVTNQQLRQALILKSFNENKTELHPDSITVFIKTLPEPTRSIALNFWDYSNFMQRSNVILNQLAPMLGLSPSEVDNMFIYAGSLN